MSGIPGVRHERRVFLSAEDRSGCLVHLGELTRQLKERKHALVVEILLVRDRDDICLNRMDSVDQLLYLGLGVLQRQSLELRRVRQHA